MKIKFSNPGVLLSLIVFAHLAFAFFLLEGVAHGRYSYHVDNAWRALSAYQWSRAPFITYDAVRFPLEFVLYGSFILLWTNIPAALATLTLLFSAGCLVLVFLLARLLTGSVRSGVLAALTAAFIPQQLLASVGVMSEVMLCFWVLGGLYLYLRCIEGSGNRFRPMVLYGSSIFFLLASAQRIEGWWYVTCYLILLVLWRLRRHRKKTSPIKSAHLVFAAVASAVFIPVYIFYAHLQEGMYFHASRFLSFYIDALVYHTYPGPRILIYPLFLFRLEPVLFVMGILGLALMLVNTESARTTYILFFALAFLGHQVSSLIVGSPANPYRPMLVLAYLLAPSAGFFWLILARKLRWAGMVIAVVVVINSLLNLRQPVKTVRDYVVEEGDIDLVGRYLRKRVKEWGSDVNVLVELGDRWLIPSEYYILYYIPEQAAFDKVGRWEIRWREVLFPRTFDEVYLGFQFEDAEKTNDSILDKPARELARIFVDRGVEAVVVTSPGYEAKLEPFFLKSVQLGRYTVMSLPTVIDEPMRK